MTLPPRSRCSPPRKILPLLPEALRPQPHPHAEALGEPLPLPLGPQGVQGGIVGLQEGALIGSQGGGQGLPSGLDLTVQAVPLGGLGRLRSKGGGLP